ncbi:Tn3 family transposase [Streptomyces vinaceus]|uniref:Tn3 family transposase n=1 Tax=Streptomyces vinaceus TaxID=1960 RepID=UPI0035D64A44
MIGSKEYADWSEQLLPWEQVEVKLSEYLVEVGMLAPGETTAFDGRALSALLRGGGLTRAAAAADGEHPDNDELFIAPDTGVPKLKARRAKGAPQGRRAAGAGNQGAGCRSGRCCVSWARTAYWIEWWHWFGPASGNDPKLKDPFGRDVITTFLKGKNTTFAEAARHIADVSAHELSVAARQRTTAAKANEALTDVVNAHAKLNMSRAWGNGTTAAADGTHKNTSYTAFREVLRAIRTVQLLRGRRVTAATNKAEAFNGFSDWVRFGRRGTVAHPGHRRRGAPAASRGVGDRPAGPAA